MYNTFKCISKISVKELEKQELEDIVQQFQASTDEHFRNKCFVYVFRSIFPMLLKIHHSDKYSKLSHIDKTEVCIVRTLYAMEHWTPGRGHKVTSYIYMCVDSQMKTLLNILQDNNKHKVYDNIINCDDTFLMKLLERVPYNSTEKWEHFITDLSSSPILTKDEVKYCQSIIKGYKTTKQLAQAMDLSSVTMYNRRSKKFVTEAATEKNVLKYCGYLKNSIKQKLKENNYNLF